MICNWEVWHQIQQFERMTGEASVTIYIFTLESLIVSVSFVMVSWLPYNSLFYIKSTIAGKELSYYHSRLKAN